MCDRNIKYSLPFLSKEPQCYYSNAYIINVVWPMWELRSSDSPGHILCPLKFTGQVNTLTLYRPSLWFMWSSRTNTLTRSSLMRIVCLHRIQIFMRTAANPKQKFTSGIKGYANQAHPSPRGGGYRLCLVALILFLPGAAKWVAKL